MERRWTGLRDCFLEVEASGEAGRQWVTEVCNDIVKEGYIPDD